MIRSIISNRAIFVLHFLLLSLLMMSASKTNLKNENVSPIRLRTFPYPYKAALTIVDDIDRQDWEDFKYIQNFYNEHDLEIGESFWMYHDTEVYPSPEIEFSYLKGISKEKSEFAEEMTQYIRCGIFDALHTFAQTQPRESSNLSRADYKCAIDELKNNVGVYLKHWINHGDSPDKIGPDSLCRGDNPNSKYYHTDFTNCHKSNGYYSFKFYHTWKGAYHNPCYILPEKVLSLDTLDDGSKVYTYLRYHGVADPPRSNEVHLQLSDDNLKSLVENRGVTMLYMHLGTVDEGKLRDDNYDHGIDEVFPPLDKKGEAQLLALSKHSKMGDIYVTTSSKLLQYLLSWQKLNYSVNGFKIIIHSIEDEVKGSYVPNFIDLQGISFYTPKPESIQVVIDMEEVTSRLIKNPSDGIEKSISFPLIRITRPDDYPLIILGITNIICSSPGYYRSISYGKNTLDRQSEIRVNMNVSVPYNSGDVSIRIDQYSSNHISFSVSGTARTMDISIYNNDDYFRVINNKKYALLKNKIVQDIQNTIDGELRFHSVSIGGYYTIKPADQ